MVDTQPEVDDTYMPEVWGLFGVGAVILGLRFFVRIRSVGIRGMQGDDYMSIGVFLCYLIDAITIVYTYRYGTNVDFSVETLENMSEAQRHQIKVGSQVQLLAWYTYTLLIWLLKGCMLFFFNRLTFGLQQQRWVKILSWVTGLSYAVVFLTISVGCHPIEKNYQVLPYPGDTCAVKEHNFYVSTVLNVLTDAAILCIPMPLLFNLQAPLRKKIALGILLSSGVFVITAALVRIIMTLSAAASGITINRWGVRETIAGIIAVNVPILKPLFTRAFWKGGHSSSSDPSSYANRKYGNSSHPKSSGYEMSTDPYSSSRSSHHDLSSAHKPNNSTNIASHELDDVSDTHAETSSQERIIRRPSRVYRTNSSGETVASESARDSSREADVERGSGGQGMPEIGGVRVERSYHVRPQSEEGQDRGAFVGSGPPSQQRGLWRPDLRGRQGYGNHVTIGGGK